MKSSTNSRSDSDEDEENLWTLKPKKWKMKIAVKNHSTSEKSSKPKSTKQNGPKKKVSGKSKPTATKRKSLNNATSHLEGTTQSSEVATNDEGNLCNKTPQTQRHGNCPHCQMPFSVLRLESPRLHVTQCMDLPINAERECMDGTKCDSTIASHYRKFLHIQLANLRAGVNSSPGDVYEKHQLNSEDNEIDGTDAHNKGESTVHSESGDKGKLLVKDKMKGRKSSGKNGKMVVKLPFGTSVNFTAKPVDGAPKDPETPVEIAKRKLCFSETKPVGADVEQTVPKECEKVVIKEEVIEEVDVDHAKRKLNFPGSSPLVQNSKSENLSQTKQTGQVPKLPEIQENGIPISQIKQETLSEDYESEDDIFKSQDNASADSNCDISIKKEIDGDDTQEKNEASSEMDTLPVSENESQFSDDDWMNDIDIANDPDKEIEGKEVTASQASITQLLEMSELPDKDQPVKTPIQESKKSSTSARKRKSPKGAPKLLPGQTSISAFFQPKRPKTDKVQNDTATSNADQTADTCPIQQETSKKDKPKVPWSLPKQGTSKTLSVPPPPLTSVASNESTSSSSNGRWKNRQCPFYKKIPNTGFTVDAFSYGSIPGCTAYFLSHFHYDHYMGLKKSFSHPMYCSKITKNLIDKKIKVADKYLHPLSLDKPHIIQGVEVTFIEANHCPGAVLILFKLRSGQVYLHTGDFRADTSMEQHPALQGIRVNTLFLDTTYCDPSYAFPPQQDVIKFAANLTVDFLHKNPNTLVVVGSYTIGKERIFVGIAEALDCKICVMREKKHILDCIEDPIINKRVTLESFGARLHVLPMNKLRIHELRDYLHKFKPRYDHILALEPTGWTHSKKGASLEELKPKVSKEDVTIYGVPYSEHSSYTEMRRFAQFVKADKIQPTVNVGNPSSRKKMESLFNSWMNEKTIKKSPQTKQSGLADWLKK